MLPRNLLICILDLIAARTAFGWNHVSKSQFQSLTRETSITLVAFVNPETEASKALEAEWISATSQTNQHLLSIDCKAEADLCAEYDVVSFPAIRLLKGSESSMRYKGPRKSSEIIPFLHRAVAPTVSLVNQKNITTFTSSDETVFIAYTTPEDHHLQSTFAALASKNHDKYAFGIATDKNLANSAGITLPSIVCLRPGEGEQEVLSGEAGIDAIEKFIETATAPTIGEFTRRNEMKYMKAGKSLVYFFAKTEAERDAYKAPLKPVAKKYKEYLSFVTVDAVEYGHMLPALGHAKGSSPVVSVFNPMYGQVFPFAKGKKITAESVEGFVMDIVQGKVQPSVPGQERVGIVHDEM
ncbi:uncharacterized protein LY89DRAFT_97094 [Mollisia scopiformis]|uniref:Thioredoxin domain-containing protein n=1 Tax=Mollisia scopiformis TaxID=149040 RepID=A0A194X6N3_MOLSC|nr:uncharacterized protein LY89DRAFT_97094 [Mollisia scopiformis]KUJ15828.1 hypothetical protein LY89DRAFT_97094 [Mollisia scopiformis]